jgi:hypothetical protein
MLFAVALQALDKARESGWKNVFFYSAGGIFNSKCKRWAFWLLSDWMELVDR